AGGTRRRTRAEARHARARDAQHLRARLEDAQRPRPRRSPRQHVYGLPHEDPPAGLQRHPPRRSDLHLRKLRAHSVLQDTSDRQHLNHFKFQISDLRLPCPLCLSASNSTTPVATLTFNEFTRPRIGIEMIASHFSRTSLLIPFPSLPITSATGTLKSKSV